MEHTDTTVTRRTLLKSGLAAAAGLALPGAAGGATSASRETVAEPGTPPDSVMPALVSYMSEAQTRPLPAEAAEHTRLHVLDTFAAMVSGSELPPGRAALRFVDAYDAGGGGGGGGGGGAAAAPRSCDRSVSPVRSKRRWPTR